MKPYRNEKVVVRPMMRCAVHLAICAVMVVPVSAFAYKPFGFGKIQAACFTKPFSRLRPIETPLRSQNKFENSTILYDPINSDSVEQEKPKLFHIDAVRSAILIVYFVQGALGLAKLAITFFLKDSLHLSPVDAGALTGLTTLPWIIKPLYGLISDGFPLFGYKRRSYLLLSGLVGSISWIVLGTASGNIFTSIVCILIGSASVAFGDVVADSIVVERSRDTITSDGNNTGPDSQFETSSCRDTERKDLTSQNDSEARRYSNNNALSGDLQSLCWGAAAVGGILSAYFSGSLLTSMTPQQVFILTSIFPLLTAAAALLIEEEPGKESTGTQTGSGAPVVAQQIGAQVGQLTETLRNPAIYLPVLFVFLWQATPSPDTAIFYFYTNDLQFQPEFLGRVRLVSSVASLAGVLAYRTWLRRVPIKRLLFWATAASVPLGLTQVLLTTHANTALGIPDELFVLSDSAVLAALGQLAFMPLLVLAASLCPPGEEGALFASLMSIYNAAGTLSGELGAGLTSILGISDHNFDSLTTLVVLCSCCPLLVLPLIEKLLPASGVGVQNPQ